MPDTFNKGEWSEFYAFIKILADGCVYAADEALNRIDDIQYPVHGVLRKENDIVKYYNLKNSENIIIEKIGDLQPATLHTTTPKLGLKEDATSLFLQIKNGKGSSFSLEIADELKAKFLCTKIKADSQNKEDIILVIHDYVTSRENQVGFSIKSNIGASPTLLNASKATNFRYSVTNFSGCIDGINSIETKSKVRDRIAQITKNGGHFEFLGTPNTIFTKNIRKVDSLMPTILSEILMQYYQGAATSIQDLTRLISESSCMHSYNLDFDTLKFKIKYLLLNVALGMMPATLWDGFIKADGGYIVVKEDGDILCYHIYNIAQFSEYLFRNTKLDTPSTSKHNFGVLNKIENALYLDLNLQVRFI